MEWYNPIIAALSAPYDKVYASKVFSFTPDIDYYINAKEVIYGGSGYAIKNINGKEIFDKTKDTPLPYEIEHIYPDYSIYPELTKDTAYGFLTRGCPRGCDFCHVEAKEGPRAYKVADLSEFWKGQKNICLCDPNILACTEWRDLLQQLIDSKAKIDINQGLDIRLMTEKKAEIVKKIKVKRVHFAFDRYEDKEIIIPKLKMFKDVTGWGRDKVCVFVLVNFNTTINQDLERIYSIRDAGFAPYVMIYNKDNCEAVYKRMQRWVNNRIIFNKCATFAEYYVA